MEHIRLAREGSLLVVTLARGKVNALNESMLDELNTALKDAESDRAIRGLVLGSAGHRVFCAGFDVTEAFEYGPDRMRTFFGRFLDVFERLRTLPKPTVAALSGHTYAAGALMAFACDVRILAEGHFGLAVNEITLGVMLPERMVRAIAAQGRADVMRAMFLGGEVVTPERALATGLVSETAPPSTVLEVATSRARALAERPAEAFAAHKRALDPIREPLSDREREQSLDQVMRVWFSEESQVRRKALVEKLASQQA